MKCRKNDCFSCKFPDCINDYVDPIRTTTAEQKAAYAKQHRDRYSAARAAGICVQCHARTARPGHVLYRCLMPTRGEKQNAKGAKVLDRGLVKRDALDAMWSFVQPGWQKANVPALKENCELLHRMLTQKTAGQEAYRKRTDVDFANIDAVTDAIVIEAMALWLSGELDKFETK